MQRSPYSAAACALAFLILSSAVAGCGQKGDLYLPDEPQASGEASAGTSGPLDEFGPDDEDAVTVQGPR